MTLYISIIGIAIILMFSISVLANITAYSVIATLVLILGKKDDTLKMKIDKARSFRKPDNALEFTVDYDKGIFESKLSAMDAVKAKLKKAKAVEETRALDEQPTDEGDDEIW